LLAKALRTVMLLLALPAMANAQAGNRTFFNEDIFVAQGQQIHNALCLFCSVQVEGDITGHVIVLFGSLNVTGRVEGNTAVVGGNTVIDSGARLGRNAIVIGGNAVYETDDSIAENAWVLGGHLSTMGGHAKSTRRLSFSPIFFSSIGVVCLLLLSALFLPRRAEAA
jgi:hypothetical protein